MIIRLLNWSIRVFGLLGILIFVYLNLRLYDTPRCTYESVDLNLVGQLHFLKGALHENNAGAAAQNQYPEGFMFIHALYALAWCDAVMDLPPENMFYQEAVEEVGYCLQQMESPKGNEVFDSSLPLKFGAFYRGWLAYVRGRYFQLDRNNTMVFKQFEADCSAIAAAIQETQKPYLESYNGLAWPADNIVCLAALTLHDQLLEVQFATVRVNWLERIKGTLAPDSHLIPHGYDLQRNSPLEGIRGSSQALMLAFLPEIEPMFSQNQYQGFRKLFLDYRMGLPGIREYPQGNSGPGDIDSGPVLLGIGGAASIVGVRAASLHGDWDVAEGLSNGTGALLFPNSSKNVSHHLFRQLPILDAFIAWSNAKMCRNAHVMPSNWRWKFQAISVIILSFLAWGIWKTRKTRH